jgi:predicted metalloprotease with PDZ domain
MSLTRVWVAILLSLTCLDAAEAGAPTAAYVVSPEMRDSALIALDVSLTIAAGRDGRRVISRVLPDSPAYAAGLREGMIYVRREEGTYGDSTKPYQLRVGDGTQERILSFLPAGSGTETLQQVAAPPGLSTQARAACVAVVASAP